MAASMPSRAGRWGLIRFCGHFSLIGWMIADMAASTATVAWIGAGGVIIGAAVGALSGWASAVISSSKTRKDAVAGRRRSAYADYIEALDGFLRLLLAPGALENRGAMPEFEHAFDLAVRSVDRSCVAVLLAGSKEAREAAEEMRDSRWALSEVLLVKPGDAAAVALLANGLARMSDDFTELARTELR